MEEHHRIQFRISTLLALTTGMAAVMMLFMLISKNQWFFSTATPALMLLLVLLFSFLVLLPVIVFAIAWLCDIRRRKGTLDANAKRYLNRFETIFIVGIGLLIIAATVAVVF